MSPPPDAARIEAAVMLKSRPGLRRLVHASRYSVNGLRAAFRHEAAFRQELAFGLPLLVAAWWLDVSRWQSLLLSAAVVFVWIVELLNSAIEVLADRVSTDWDPLIGRAKDIGSAAVMLSLLLAAAVWGVVLWP